MAVCLRVEGNRVRCYCSNHQGQDIARRTLEKIINLTPKRDAYTWPQSPCHCVWIVYTMFLVVGFPIQRANLHSYLKSREKEVPARFFIISRSECLRGGFAAVIIDECVNPFNPSQSELNIVSLRFPGFAWNPIHWSSDSGCTIGIGFGSWIFTLNEKEVLVLMRCLTTRDLPGVSKRLMGMST